MHKFTINEHYKKFFPEKLSYSEKVVYNKLKDGFVLKFNYNKALFDGSLNTVFEIPGVLKVESGVFCFPGDMEKLSGYQKGECYNVYADENGKSPFIEASLMLSYNGETKKMTLGFPVNCFDIKGKDLFLLYDGVRFAWIINGEIENINFPVGNLDIPKDTEDFSCDDGAYISYDARFLQSEERVETLNKSIAYYSARGYNAWAGDVANFSHDGIYHLLVLLDRHHHGNRFGGGAHSVYHMTTKDFVHWENYGELYPIQNNWESFGTGTMFFFDGKYYYSHGFHTDRVIPKDKVGSRLLEKNYKRDGFFSAVTYDELKENGLYPSGANYMVSDDGIHFVQGKKQIHCAENPSIYVDENGGLIMYAGYGSAGVWHAPNIDGPWKKEDTDMPLFDNSSPVRNSSECPSIFEWNGYKYIIMGFNGFWQSGYKNNEFLDLAATGEDIYDGLGVPMVAEYNGRYIISGWVNGHSWAFITQHRELIQHSNGRLGIRWMPELTPNPDELVKVSSCKNVTDDFEVTIDKKTSYYMQCKVNPNRDGRVGFEFSGEGTPCVFELNTKRKKVQMGKAENHGGFQDEIKALYEYIPEMPEERISSTQIPSMDIHYHSKDFSIANVAEIEKPYVLKAILHYEPKTGNMVFDAEIGEGRTFISNRVEFKADKIKVLSYNAEISDFVLCVMPDDM